MMGSSGECSVRKFHGSGAASCGYSSASSACGLPEQPLLLVGQIAAGEQVGASRRSCGAAPAPAAIARCGHGRPTGAPRAPCGPGSRRGACTAGTRAACPRTTRRRSTPRCRGRRAPDGRRPRSRRAPRPRRRRARSRRSTARRRRGGRRPAGRRPRSGRTATRSPRPRRARPRSDWSRRRPPGARRNSGRGGSTASTAANSGSGIITMPGAAAHRRVVDAAVTVGREVARVVQPHVEQRRRRGPGRGSRPRAAPSRYSGKIVKTSTRITRSQVEQAVGNVDDRHGRRCARR